MSVCLIIGILYLHLHLVKTDTKVLYWENNSNSNFIYSIPISSEKESFQNENIQKVVFLPVLNGSKDITITKSNNVQTYIPGAKKIYNWLKYYFQRLSNSFSIEENQRGFKKKAIINA